MKPAAIRRELRALADPQIAAHSQRFFRTGPGEYGEGDRFLGIRVPPLRKLAVRCTALSLPELRQLLTSDYHEERLLALLTLVRQLLSRRAGTFATTGSGSRMSLVSADPRSDVIDVSGRT